MGNFSLDTTLIPRLKKLGIKYRYIGGVYDPMTIIVTYKTLDVCRVDAMPDGVDTFYRVYWFSTVRPLRKTVEYEHDYNTSCGLCDDIVETLYMLSGKKEKESYYVGGRHLGKSYSWRNEYQKERDKFDIKDIIFNNPATIVLWADGTKTVVKAENEEFDPEKGLAMAIAKKALGNNYDYYDTFKKYVGRYEKKQKKG